MVSFNIVRLFINVTRQDILQISTDAVYRGHLGPHLAFLKSCFWNLYIIMELGEFSFNDIMHVQIDGVSIGRLLGTVLTNIFIVFFLNENILFERYSKTNVYLRFVDDTFSVFDSMEEAEAFYLQLNFLHPSIQFTVEWREILFSLFFF